jgi:predicted HicB family RNase H-like nuclease
LRLKYKGYTGYVEFDDEARVLNGEALELKDVITFQGKTAEEIKKAFRESIDGYLEFCREGNVKADNLA